jgi:hypothetical protein
MIFFWSKFSMRINVKIWTMALAAVLGLVAMSGVASAGSLLPGTSIANDGNAATASGGTLLADTGFEAYTLKDTFGHVKGTGFVREIVVKGDTSNPNGTSALTFIYQVKDTTGFVGHVSMTDYTGFATDASAVTAATQNANDPAGTGAFTATSSPAGLLKGSTPINRTGDGSAVSFDFDDGKFGAGKVSAVMIIRTDSREFVTGSISVIDGGTGNVPGFAPGPEPASLVLFGGCFLGLGAAALKRRWKKGQPAAV